MPRVIAPEGFVRLLEGLPQQMRDRARAKLRLLSENPRHPSLRVKRMPGYRGIWEMSVTMKYRITFEYEGDRIVLRKIGPHDVLSNP